MSGFLRRLFGRATSPAPGIDMEAGLSDERLEDMAMEPGAPVADPDLPRVSITILNYNGRQHLAGCFGSLSELDYSKDRLEVVLVDNGSTDDSLDQLEAFAALNGPAFYGLPVNTGTVTLERADWVVPETVPLAGGGAIRPFLAGETVRWRLADGRSGARADD